MGNVHSVTHQEGVSWAHGVVATMNRRQTLRPYQNAGYDPYVDRQEEPVSCSVCGFKGIDAERWTDPEEAVFEVITTGTTYQPPAGTPVDQLGSVIDKTTEVRYIAYQSCPHCGAANWGSGSAPDLLR
jgi:predicted RNA-binding Zn-ribbon protein involved in translation (DUF1610 family)